MLSSPARVLMVGGGRGRSTTTRIFYAVGYLVGPMKPNPHDVDLPAPLVKKRRQARSVAHWMLLVAGVTAVPGWLLYGTSFHYAVNLTAEPAYRVILAWALLLISSVTLVLGLWYLLLAQVRRIARMAGQDEPGAEGAGAVRARPHCGNCGWPHDAPDRFCRHCGKAIVPSPSIPS